MSNLIRKEQAQLDNETIYLKYLSMGDGRTISRLSALTGKTENALYKLQKRYRWQERLEQDTQALSKPLSLVEIGGMESSELLAATNRATIEKLAMYVQHAEPTNMRDAQILVSIHNLIKTETAPKEAQESSNLVPVVLDLIDEYLKPEDAKLLISKLGELAARQISE